MNKEQIIEQLNSSTDSKEILHLRGQLIKILKEEIKLAKDYSQKNKLDLKLLDEMKKHKEHISKMRKEAKEKKYPIPERVALKTKEIAAVMELFMKEKDVLGRLKNGATSATFSSLFASAVSLGIVMLSGGTVGLAGIASVIPTACYVGLSSLISGSLNETQKSKLYKDYENAPEETKKVMKFCQDYIINNEQFVRASVNETKLENTKEKITNEKKLIEEYKKIIENTPNDQLKQVITLEMIGVMKKLDYNYEVLQNDYLYDREKLSEDEYKKLVEEKNNLKKDILIKNSFYEDTIKTAAKNIGKNTAITYASRIALSTLFPSLAFGSVGDALTPFLYTLLGNALSLGNISDSIKMKETNYTGKIIKMSHPELFEEERNKEVATLQVA